MSYKDLEIWQLAREVAIEIHKMTLEQLPNLNSLKLVSKNAVRPKVLVLQLLKVMAEEHIRPNILNS